MYNKEDLNEILDDDNEIILFSKKVFDNLCVPEEVVNIMVNIGLPRSVSPYISFYTMEKGGGKLLSSFYNIQNYINNKEFDVEELNEIWKEFT